MPSHFTSRDPDCLLVSARVIDVRVVAATNQDLKLAVDEGRFRRDLFHRLSQIQRCVPPLRERPEDIVALAQHFLALKDSGLKLSGDALRALACYRYPGNVRELRNLVAKLAMAALGPEIGTDELLSEVSVDTPVNQPALPVTKLEGMEEQMIIKALENTGGHRGLAANLVQYNRFFIYGLIVISYGRKENANDKLSPFNSFLCGSRAAGSCDYVVGATA